MFFIVVYWQINHWGYQTFGDFNGALNSLDFQYAHGYNAELWMWDGERWYRIDFVNNNKHVPYAKPIG
jgi:hypothetical protein